MRKWLLGALVLLLLAIAAGVVLEPTGVVLGRLRGETFYRGRPVSTWRRALLDQDPRVHVETVAVLKDGQSEGVPVLTELLRWGKDGDWSAAEVRWTAAELLGQIGPPAKGAIPALAAALHDPDPHVRAVAAGSLASIGTPPADA